MLSKLQFFRQHPPEVLAKLRLSIESAEWEERLGALPGSLRLLPGGTLNVALRGELVKGGSRVFKTHVTSEGRAPLRREGLILDHLYRERCPVEAVSTSERDWLIMPVLEPVPNGSRPKVEPGWIRDTLNRAAEVAAVRGEEDHLALITCSARDSLSFLTDNSEIPRSQAMVVERHLEDLAVRASEFQRITCHGDLGPRNIMHDEAGLLLMDWEDVFMGIPGYDWIYWLTFFENRPLLDAEHLAMSGLPVDFALSLLVAILVTKCELSVRTGMATSNRMTTEQRLAEALALRENSR